MSKERWGRWIALAVILLVVWGCKKKESGSAQTPAVVGPGAAEVAALRDALTRGMQPVDFDKLAKTHIGKRCVVAARSTPIPPPPPPLGMVRIMGSTTFYAGELNDVTSDGLKIRAAYPSSGNYKYVELARADIQSVHIRE
jgi:hypothetical protein